MVLVALVTKLQVNSPLKFQLVRRLSRISLKNLLLDPEASLLKFENFGDNLFSDKQMPSSEADRLSCNMNLSQMRQLKNREEFEGFQIIAVLNS